MEINSGYINRLIEELERLPGIGNKSAQRMAYYIVSLPNERVEKLTSAIDNAKKHTHYCKECLTMTDSELSRSRDLARNPADLRGHTNFYPHCTANVETRDESVFAARNVTDGLRFNTFHGEWPYESWGIGARTDAWCRIDFGRDVIAERMALTLRADFPHDAYWVSGHMIDSNGDDMAFELQKTGFIEQYQNGEHQFGTKESTASRSYSTMVKNYTGVIRTLLSCLPEEKQKPAEDSLGDFLRSRK